jgi:transposase
MFLLPPSLDDLIAGDHPVRFVDSFVESLGATEWEEMDIRLEGNQLGAPSYHARLMMGAWLYGFMVGVRTNRGLEKVCRERIPFLWLTGLQQPDHNSFWRFYRDHRERMRVLIKQTVRTAVKVGLVDLAVQSVDGTKVKGNATRRQTFDEKGLRRLMKRVDEAITELEAQCEAEENGSEVRLPQELIGKRKRREQVERALKEVQAEDGPKRVNLTDPDAKLMKGRQGVVAGYNAQAMVSPLKEEHGGGMIITAADVTNVADDHEQLLPMIEQAEENNGQRAGTTLGDGGYHSGKNLDKCEEGKHRVLMPEAQQKALKKPYHKDHFEYDAERDEYCCPKGKVLVHKGLKRRKDRPEMQVYRCGGKVCRECPAIGECTKDERQGRAIEVGPYERLLRTHRELMAQEESKELYKRRMETVEPVFGIMKERQDARRLLLRGLRNVKAEWTLLCTAFNLRSLWRIWAKSPSTWTWAG